MSDELEVFIKTELPKRPFLETDVPENSVFVREGQGPRQMGAVPLLEGEVLGCKNGRLVGVRVNIRSETYDYPEPSEIWYIAHGAGTTHAFISLRDTEGKEIYGDDVFHEPNSITITFDSPQAGTAAVVIL